MSMIVGVRIWTDNVRKQTLCFCSNIAVTDKLLKKRV